MHGNQFVKNLGVVSQPRLQAFKPNPNYVLKCSSPVVLWAGLVTIIHSAYGQIFQSDCAIAPCVTNRCVSVSLPTFVSHLFPTCFPLPGASLVFHWSVSRLSSICLPLSGSCQAPCGQCVKNYAQEVFDADVFFIMHANKWLAVC